MGKDKLPILLIFVAAMGAVAGFRYLRTSRDPSETANAEPVRPSAAGELRGICLQFHSSSSSVPYEQYIAEISQTGANTICFVVHGHQENASSNSIFVDSRKTPGDDRLRELMAAARRKGLRIVLMPIVLLENPREGEWRGVIVPKDGKAWWHDYGQLVMQYARLAETGGAEMFIVGSELVKTEPEEKSWRGLIRQVRRVYKGKLCYSANWDHYEPVKWWDALDVIGMTTYYDLTGGKKPTLKRLTDAWRPIKAQILEWRNKNHPGHPILFTEVGWPNQETCAQYPWNYYQAPDKPDPTAQANCFEAFFQTWIHEEAVAGFLVWEWRNLPEQGVGPKDTSYIPCGKPALNVIRKYYRMPKPQSRLQSRCNGIGDLSRPAATRDLPAGAKSQGAPASGPADAGE